MASLDHQSEQDQAALIKQWLLLIWSFITRIPNIQLQVGLENRPDNVMVMKDFLYIDVVNESLISSEITDAAITYHSPYRRVTIKSIIVAEEQNYPVKLRSRERLRINLLPSLIDLNRVDYISVTLASGREFRLKSKLPSQMGEGGGGKSLRVRTRA